MYGNNINPYIEKIFGDWYKKIILSILLIPTIFFIMYGTINKWIDQNFAIEILFLLAGVYIGGYFKNDKRGY